MLVFTVFSSVHLRSAEPTVIAWDIRRVVAIVTFAAPDSGYKSIAAEHLYPVSMHYRHSVNRGLFSQDILNHVFIVIYQPICIKEIHFKIICVNQSHC